MKIDQRWERREEISNNNGNLMVSSLDQTGALGSDSRYKYCIHSTVLYKNYCNIRYAYINEKKDERKKKTRCGSSSSKMKQVVFIIYHGIYNIYLFIFVTLYTIPRRTCRYFIIIPFYYIQWMCKFFLFLFLLFLLFLFSFFHNVFIDNELFCNLFLIFCTTASAAAVSGGLIIIC